jgi:hypothetical protein
MTHLDPDVLAEFRAGLITGRRGARIGAHLAACDRCAALGDGLAEVSALLGAVPAAAMPDSVAQRLDTALAAEVARRDHAERAGQDGSPERETRRRPARNRGFRLVALRVLAPAAAVVLLAAGGYGLSRIGSGPSTQASSSAGRAASPQEKGTGAAAGGRGPVAGPVSGGVPSTRPQMESPGNYPVVISTTVFRPATIKQQVEAALLMPRSARKTQAAPTAIRACVHYVAGGANPVLVESAHFGSQPATIIVVQAGRTDIVSIVGSRCSAANRDQLAWTTVPAGISGP